jgi:hypothetical protein
MSKLSKSSFGKKTKSMAGAAWNTTKGIAKKAGSKMASAGKSAGAHVMRNKKKYAAGAAAGVAAGIGYAMYKKKQDGKKSSKGMSRRKK